MLSTVDTVFVVNSGPPITQDSSSVGHVGPGGILKVNAEVSRRTRGN